MYGAIGESKKKNFAKVDQMKFVNLRKAYSEKAHHYKHIID